MQIILLGLLMALVGLIIALIIGNLIIFLLLHDLPWLRLFRQQHDVETFRNLAYVKDSANPKHRLDLYRPKGKKRYPTVVFIHGGYWTSGDKEYYQAFTGLYANIGVALARNGVGAAVINYRLAPTVRFEELLGDAVAAIRWTQDTIADYDGDGNRLYLMGHAAGGQLAALLVAEGAKLKEAGIHLSRIKGYVLLSAIYDIEDMAKANDAAFNEQVTHPVFGKDPASYARWSPIAHFRLGMPRTLMLTAERDFPYLRTQEERARLRLEELHAGPTAFIVPGYTHMDMVLKFGRDHDEVLQRTLDFIGSEEKPEKH
ncbi:MAG TPA: alpha/beta hydrolase [Patescibacteria group bacterium]|nr:alpha/beta hydrolase [Patescibacteria group bacterium]